jgi:hypothetical protein
LGKTDAINAGKSSNFIIAVCASDSLSLFVNDVFLANVTDDDFSSGKVGVFTGTQNEPGVDLLFDNFDAHKP